MPVAICHRRAYKRRQPSTLLTVITQYDHCVLYWRTVYRIEHQPFDYSSLGGRTFGHNLARKPCRPDQGNQNDDAAVAQSRPNALSYFVAVLFV